MDLKPDRREIELKIDYYNWGGFLKNDASPSGLGHWFRNLGSLKRL